ncbi:MAG: helix-turn-helix transcriptional regulator [Candidatus Methanomethylophilaceae archaeon]|nr:helix-turn-helix transcriptional regulator [Candidatus Methanomethylophilaceae archaeon]
MYNTAISERIHAMRDLCGLTTKDMAEATGVSEEEYIRCETGQQDFTFTFLSKCADRFQIDMVELITGENPRLTDYIVVEDGMGLPINRRTGHEYYHLAAYFKDKLAEPYFVRAPYSEEEQDRAIPTSTYDGQEMIYVIAGSLRFAYDGHEENLIAGDFVYYDASKPHGEIATSKDGCEFLIITMKGGSR